MWIIIFIISTGAILLFIVIISAVFPRWFNQSVGLEHSVLCLFEAERFLVGWGVAILGGVFNQVIDLTFLAWVDVDYFPLFVDKFLGFGRQECEFALVAWLYFQVEIYHFAHRQFYLIARF